MSARRRRETPEGDRDALLNREILLGLWKVHILHHAAEGPIHGQWILAELRRHGYDVSPGTIYPLLKRMERNGWIRARRGARPAHAHARQARVLTAEGRKILARLRAHVKELAAELMQVAQ